MEEEVDDMLNWEQEQAIKLEVEGKLPELAEHYKKEGRKKQTEKVIIDIQEEDKNKENKKEVEELEKYNKLQKEHCKLQRDYLFSKFDEFTNFLSIAKVFIKYQPIYYDNNRIWWIWNKKEIRWERIDETDLLNAIDEHTQNPSVHSRIKNEILEALKRVGRKNKPIDAKETWVQFKETIIDILTGERLEASPKYFITNPIPWKLGKSEETPTIDKIFREWVFKEGIQEDSYVKTLNQIMAYCLVPSMPIHRIFCLIGEGLNGKGSFLRVVEKLVGESNKCATEVEVLSSNRFESAQLFKKLVCFVGEIDKGIFKKTKTLKSLSGDDLVRFEIKGKDGFHGHNYAKPLIATNHLPETSDKSKGFYRRWTIIDFPNTFNEKKKIENEIPEVEFENFCLKSIKILKELIEVGEFCNDGTIKERENKYERHSNFIGEFINLYCEKGINCYISFSEFCDRYNEYLLSEGILRKSKIEIGRSILLRGLNKKIRSISTDIKNSTEMVIEGIKFKEDIII